MPPKTILFDLDGTLTDSGDGIMNCAAVALEHFGLPVPDRKDMEFIVGPPLKDSFLKLGIPEADCQEAIDVFRVRYADVGKYENFPYPGIKKLLENLKAADCRLYVATSKPEVMAVDILRKFELAPYFERICGATLDSSRTSKSQVIEYLLSEGGFPELPVMVGDTEFDVLGAAAHGIPTIGVSWGYGSVSEMKKAGATAIADSPEELFRLLTE